jgi:glycosyltransferase involved in cell wall biosynthesis
MRVAIVAENASKLYGGEAILPFHYFRLLRARGIDAFLVVHSRTRAELTALFPNDLERLRFVVDMPLQKLFFRLGKPLPRRVSEATFGLANQLLTQWAQRAILRQLVVRSKIDIIHQPIPVSPRFPSLLWNLGAPLICGPLNGGMEYPPAFRASESILSRAAIALGRSLSNLVNALLPGKRRAALVLVANPRTRAALPSGLQGRISDFPENGVDLAQWPASPAPPIPGRFLFLGRLVDFKALDLVLRALPAVAGATLDVIGGGPMEAAWKSLASSLGISDRVRFLGPQPQSVCAEHLGQSVALVLPSLYECGGAVVLEAMAMARPVIATAWGGPADYLDPACGILIEPRSPAFVVDAFAAAMHRLMHDPDLCIRMGQHGQRKVHELYDWEKKIDRILDLYASISPVPQVFRAKNERV